MFCLFSAFFPLMCHKEFTCCSCTLSMHRPLSCLPPLSCSLASTDSASSCRIRMHTALGIYLPSCSAFLHFAYFSPVQFFFTLCLHFSFSIFHSVLSHFYLVLFSFLSFSTGSPCIIFMLSKASLFLCLPSHIFAQFLVSGSFFPFCLGI